MMKQSQNDPGHTSALKEIADARAEAGRELAELGSKSINPDTVSYGASSPVARAQAFVYYYFDQISPYRNRIPTLWNERVLGEVTVPRSVGNSTAGDSPSDASRRRIGPPDEHTRIVGLKEFAEWRHATAVFEGQDGQQVKRICLPVAVLQRAYDTLNDAVARLNLGVDLPDDEMVGDAV